MLGTTPSSPADSESGHKNSHSEEDSLSFAINKGFHHVGWIPNTTGHVYFRNADV